MMVKFVCKDCGKLLDAPVHQCGGGGNHVTHKDIESLGPGVQCESCDVADRLACVNIGLTIMTLCRYSVGASDAVTIARGIFCSRIIDRRKRLADILNCFRRSD